MKVPVRSGNAGVALGNLLHRLGIHIGNVHARAVGHEGLGNGQADAAGAGGDEYALGHDETLLGRTEEAEQTAIRQTCGAGIQCLSSELQRVVKRRGSVGRWVVPQACTYSTHRTVVSVVGKI